jgi:cytochrome P450 family 135
VVSLLLAARHEDGKPLTDQELRDELVTLLVAGHETTATALAWTAERLVRPPGGWEALRERGEECAEAAAKEGAACARCCQSSSATSSADDSTCCRHPRRPVDLPVHRRPELYPEPARFLPEHLLGERPQGGTYTWIPFGGGVRRCLGAAFALMDRRVVLAELARALDAAALDPAPEGTRRRGITLVPARGTEVVLS